MAPQSPNPFLTKENVSALKELKISWKGKLWFQVLLTLS